MVAKTPSPSEKERRAKEKLKKHLRKVLHSNTEEGAMLRRMCETAGEVEKQNEEEWERIQRKRKKDE